MEAKPNNTPCCLAGKVALVTGASRGIGAALAERFAANGARLVLTAHQGEDLTATADRLRAAYGTEIQVNGSDVTDSRAVQALYAEVHKTFGQLDILAANAGILIDGLIGMIRDDDIARLLDVNVAGALYHIQAASRLMRRRKTGSIIVTSSIIGRVGNKGQMVYAASKAALLGAMMSAAKELGPDGIRVNAIAPGVIDTQMTSNLSPEKRAKLVAGIALGRSGAPEEVADVGLFLASDLSRYVSGQVIGVDGGMTV